MKLGTACTQCRNGKRKCGTTTPGKPCMPCERRRLSCSREAHLRRSQHPPALQPVSSLASAFSPATKPPQAVQEELLDLYLQYIHDKPHSLFHEPSLRHSLTVGGVSPPVLYGIFGLAARFSHNAEIRAQEANFVSAARESLKADLDNICLENIQACVLVANICTANADPNLESLFYGIANRMTQILKLANDNPDGNEIQRETRRRVWWSLYLIDTWASAGYDLPRQVHLGGMVPMLPMDERIFQELRPDSPNPELCNRQPGLWAQMITLVKIYGSIQDLNRQIVEKDERDEISIELASQELAERLAIYDHELPEIFRYTPKNLEAHVKQLRGSSFIALHLGYHHYSTLLYYQYLDHQRPVTSLSQIYKDRCKYHASAFSSIIQDSRNTVGAEALYNIVGHMTVVSSSVLVHTLLFGQDPELPTARDRLQGNFEFLVQLRRYWPSLELMINRLHTFQASCLEAANNETHCLDKWMIKFLLQHALVLDDKWAFREQIRRDQDSSNPKYISTDNARLRERSRVTENIISGVVPCAPFQ